MRIDYISRKRISLIIVGVLAISLIIGSWGNTLAVFATDEQAVEQIESTALSPSASKTVTDSHGNKYKVSGLSSIVGKRADVHTEYEVTFYKGGIKSTVNNYKKKLTGTGRVWFYGAASDNQFTKSATKTGAANSFIASASYDFLIKTLHSTHKFSCEGASTSFYTEM